ncbi:hypothetical protein K466DRAFT_664377 [Polyporus arcularius HHB13444]|uniref:F-box domain-containing protein n=1 Tax=Polyporus arcularius HHB13444 TaxID=1314778 RepID=A0A5C3P8M0_9APHY|nr:hypothetical protein K466DRAFT_664377 [Polyporus arcularius HHB13444]
MVSSVTITQPAVLHDLNAAVEDVLRERWSLSMETLTKIQVALHLASSLVQETMNAHCPINKLPPELLALIFSAVPSSLSLPGYAGPSSATQTYDLLPVTHVCRGWRALALDMPSLWSTIPETATACAATSIFRARAQQAPLIVYVDRGRPSAALRDTLGQSEKIAELHLHDLREHTPAELSTDLLAFPGRWLERAIIRRRVARPGANEVDPTMVKGIVELFDGSAPKLRNLVLHDVPFLPSNSFESLTHLSVSFVSSPVYWSLHDLFELLLHTPMLQDVRISGLPTHLHPPDPPIMGSAPLPFLRRLEVGDCRGQDSSLNLMRSILAFIVLPSHCAIRLYGVDAHRLSPSTDIRIPFLEPSTTLTIDVTFTALALAAANPDTGSSLRLELNTAGATRTLLQQSIEAFVAGYATAIRHVIITSQRVWPSWCDSNLFLCLLPNVTHLELCDAHLVDQCIDALRPCMGADVECFRVICPSLEVLRLPVGLSNLLTDKLRVVLDERARCGLRLRCTVADQLL